MQSVVDSRHASCHAEALDDWWRRHFENRARWTDSEAQASAWSAAGLAARLSAFDRLLPDLAGGPGLAVLDLGCGAGTYAGRLARQGHEVTAIDFALPMVQRAHATHLAPRFAVADGYHAPFRPASFDLVLCIGVLQCCGRPRTLIREAARLVRPGGVLLIESLNRLDVVVKLLELLGRRPPSPVVRHRAGAVEGWLAAGGIEVRARIPIFVIPSRARWPAGAVLRAGGALPGLRRFTATAFWWHGRKRPAR